MRFYIGVFSIICSIAIVIASILFFDFSDLFEKLSAFIFFAIAAGLFLVGTHNISIYLEYKRILKKGFKTKARIVHIKSTILAIKDTPKFILEVIYEHPFSHKHYQTFVDYYGEMKNNLSIRENDYIDVVIDPENPTIALLSH